MKTKKPTRYFGLLLFLLSFAVVSDPLTVGAPLPELTLPDQHENQHTVVDAKVILFAPDKDAGELAHQVLSSTDTKGFESKGIIYISDISQMPSFVTSMFALPKMRDYPYVVLLGYEEAETAMFPRQEAQVTVLHVESGKIERSSFAGSAQALADLIGFAVD